MSVEVSMLYAMIHMSDYEVVTQKTATQLVLIICVAYAMRGLQLETWSRAFIAFPMVVSLGSMAYDIYVEDAGDE